MDSYYALDFDKRNVQMGFNFSLIRETLPAVDIFDEEEKERLGKCHAAFSEHMADLSEAGYNKEMERLGIDLSEQNNMSAFKRIFIEQAEFAVNEYF